MVAKVKVITLLDRMDAELLRNHRHYADMYGYEHLWFETHNLSHAKLKLAYKYDCLFQHLRALNEDDIVVLLDNHSVIFHPIDIHAIMGGRSSIVVDGPAEGGGNEIPLTNFLVMRNTKEIREILFKISFDLHNALALHDDPQEETLLQRFPVLPINTALGDLYINISWGISDWHKARIFILSLNYLGAWAGDRVTYDHVRAFIHDTHLEKVMVKRVNGALIEGKPVLEKANYPVISTDPVSRFNPHGRIAFITLYTHHVEDYSRISEHNVKRYCDRHGYAYHVYRAIPEELDQTISAAWIKSWLLKNNIANHDWVIWIDSDVLFRNPHLKIEPLLEGRDILLGKDICAWPINAGVMGFKNTPANVELIDKIWQRILEVDDKTTMWSNQSDQFHTINVMTENDILNEVNVLDCLTINTAPPMSTPNSFLTHYVGLCDLYRSVYMAHDDLISQQGR